MTQMTQNMPTEQKNLNIQEALVEDFTKASDFLASKEKIEHLKNEIELNKINLKRSKHDLEYILNNIEVILEKKGKEVKQQIGLNEIKDKVEKLTEFVLNKKSSITDKNKVNELIDFLIYANQYLRTFDSQENSEIDKTMIEKINKYYQTYLA